MSVDDLDFESEFDPTEIERNLQGPKELRMWHWGLAMQFRKFYNSYEKNTTADDREQSMIYFDKLATFHIKACQILNDLLPAGTTGESDMIEYNANRNPKRVE